jgi:hypothetical protein
MVWVTIALLYCVVCWLAAWFLFRLPHFEGGEDIRRYFAHIRLGLILLAPLFMPFVAYRLVRCQAECFQARRRLGTLRRVNRVVREYEFIPVDGSSLGEPMRGHFEALTPPLVELGFQQIGDFQMKLEPVVVHDRVLLSADGRTLATVCCVLDAGVISFMSVLDDGTCVHTSGTRNPHPERSFEPADRLSLTYLPGAHPSYLHREHEEALRTAAARTGAGVMQFRGDQFRAVMVYDQRLFNRWRYRHDGLDREPPAPDFSTLVAVPEAGCQQG